MWQPKHMVNPVRFVVNSDIRSCGVFIPHDPNIITPPIAAALRADRYEAEEAAEIPAIVMPGDVVLEIGARYGAVSSCINILLHNRENHVAIEPDPHALPILRENRKITNSKFKICDNNTNL